MRPETMGVFKYATSKTPNCRPWQRVFSRIFLLQTIYDEFDAKARQFGGPRINTELSKQATRNRLTILDRALAFDQRAFVPIASRDLSVFKPHGACTLPFSGCE